MAAPLPQMLTANRLIDGIVLWRKADGWVETLSAGDVYPTEAEAEAALAAAQADVKANKVVATYLFDVREKDGKIVPVKEREIVRAAGPSVRPDLGKQAG